MTVVKKKSKLLELDIVRAIAILAVLTIHGTSEATVELPVGSISQAVYLAINKLSNFAVPLFIFLSGVVLFYRYIDDWSGKQAVTFYLKRVKQILFPYLIWSAFYYLYNQWIFYREQFHWNTAEFLDLLPWADASYHLYFMVIIVQFYVLFPLLVTLCRMWSGFRKGLFFLGLAVQGAFYSYNHWVEPINHMPSLCVTYFSLFTLGGYVGMHYDACIAWITRHIRWVLPLSAALGLSFVGLFLLEGRTSIRLDNTWYEVLFNVYPMFAACSFIWIGRKLLQLSPALSKGLLSLGAVSFGIYLMHPAVLTYWRTHAALGSGKMLDYHAYTFSAFLLSLLVPWVVLTVYGKLMKRLRTARRPAPQKGAA
jgi:peptidoglycan/LPS O-acetylase OafA/YrhL